jgi:Ca-activated chloride channel family protein
MRSSLRTTFVCLLICFGLISFIKAIHAQTSLDEVHVTPRAVVSRADTPTSAYKTSGSLIKTSVDMVLVPVTITDGLNRPVMGLRQANFQLFEGKKAQEIKNFSSEDAPVSVGIILDSSGSMEDKMDQARDAITQFCEGANPQDEFFLITFSDQPRLAVDFPGIPETIENELLLAQPKGRTSLLDAIYMGLRKMHEARYGRKALMIISDGGDNHSRYSEGELKSEIREADVMIYAVGTYDRYVRTQEELLGPDLLRNITELTGGHAFTLTDPKEMSEVTRKISAQLRHQYVLAYQPQTPPHDGKWHKINVKLKLSNGLQFLRVQARAGYYGGTE